MSVSPGLLRWHRRQVSRTIRARAADLAVLQEQGPGCHGRYLTWEERRELRRVVARLAVLAARLDSLEEPEPEPPPPPSEEAVDLAALWDYLRGRAELQEETRAEAVRQAKARARKRPKTT